MNASQEINPANPGEVLACCGIAVLAARESPDAVTGFRREESRTVFVAPQLDIHNRVANADAESWQRCEVAGVQLNWWEPWGMNPNMKLWAGQKSPQSIVRNLQAPLGAATNEGWLGYQASVAGRMDVDPAGTWNALELGWSINEHKSVKMLCRPLVELLAMVGLQEFPMRGRVREGFTYSLWRPATHLIARMAFAGHGQHILADCQVPTDRNGSNSTLKFANVTWRDVDGQD